MEGYAQKWSVRGNDRRWGTLVMSDEDDGFGQASVGRFKFNMARDLDNVHVTTTQKNKEKYTLCGKVKSSSGP
ncbi:hypothetical protein ACH5RR_017112 [Cinchona calisaya]|uniref:Uncharacterized protein n=1 Tax=Cinchona calisaya TaxID=153742 RepID=A0ABD2ZYA4_9GENT